MIYVMKGYLCGMQGNWRLGIVSFTTQSYL